MTDEMLALARRISAKAGIQNVEFLKGEIESNSAPRPQCRRIISNCVINLSAKQRSVLHEPSVLKPGGRSPFPMCDARRNSPAIRNSVLCGWVHRRSAR